MIKNDDVRQEMAWKRPQKKKPHLSVGKTSISNVYNRDIELMQKAFEAGARVRRGKEPLSRADIFAEAAEYVAKKYFGYDSTKSFMERYERRELLEYNAQNLKPNDKT